VASAHVEHRQRGFAQELARALKPEPAVMLMDAIPDMAVEQLTYTASTLKGGGL